MKKNSIYLMFGAFCFIVGGYLLFKAGSEDQVDFVKKRLVVGMAAGYAPFVSVNPTGEYEGFDIDIAWALAKELNRELVLQDLGSMTTLLTALDQNKIDTIIWGMSITAERLKNLNMVHYQGANTTSYPLMFWEKVPAGVTTLADLNGQVVCVEPNSSQDGVLSKFAQINKLEIEKVDDALLNLQYGKAVAALVEPAIAKKFKAKYPQIQILDVPLDQDDQVRGIGIVLKPENQNLISEIQAAVQNLKTSGVITSLEQKWGIES